MQVLCISSQNLKSPWYKEMYINEGDNVQTQWISEQLVFQDFVRRQSEGQEKARWIDLKKDPNLTGITRLNDEHREFGNIL